VRADSSCCSQAVWCARFAVELAGWAQRSTAAERIPRASLQSAGANGGDLRVPEDMHAGEETAADSCDAAPIESEVARTTRVKPP
jgi:hypothetical protein